MRSVCDQAILLARYLEELGPAALSGMRVIELGAGTGLVGMVAGALGELGDCMCMFIR